MDECPPDWARYLFWLIVGCLSLCFAEIISGSYLFPYFTFEGLFIIMPVYALHTLVLGWIVYRLGKARLYPLFLAGTLLGLYEAYITKIIWNWPWGEPIVYFQGIAVVEMLVLVLFWHPLLSFIAALFTAESVLTRSREILSGLPRLLRVAFASPAGTYSAIFGFALLCGLYQGTKSPSPLYSLASAVSAGAILGILFFVYRRMGLHRYDIHKLLPTKREFIVLFVLLLLMYAVFGITVRPNALPGLIPQAIVWAMYLVFFVLLYFSLRKSKAAKLPAANFGGRFSWLVFAAFFTVVGIASALMSLTPYQAIAQVVFWSLGIATGLILLGLSIFDLFRRTDATAH